MLRFLFLLALAAVGVLPNTSASAATLIPLVDHLRIRLGVPMVLRGPENNNDSVLTLLQKNSGQFQAYVSNTGVFLAANQPSMTNIGGSLTSTIGKSVIGTADSCGNWMNTTEKVGDVWYGMVHSEGPCDYSQTSTVESMAMFSSADEGISWTPVGSGTIMSSGEGPNIPNWVLGEGDAGMIPGPDGYEYGYGGWYGPAGSVYTTGRSRAPRGQYGPGNWMKLGTDHSFSVAGVGTNNVARDLGFVGKYPAKIPGVFPAVLTTGERAVYYGPWAGHAADTAPYTLSGLAIAFSRDMVNFHVLHDPLVPYDEQQFNDRNSNTVGSDLYTYPGLLNDQDGGRILDQHHFYLTYTYIPPFYSITQRFLVMVPVTLSVEPAAQVTNVGYALERFKPAAGAPSTATYLTTVSPQVSGSYVADAQVAFLMTSAPINGASVAKLEECQRTSSGNDDYVLDVDGSCAAAGYTRLRTAGYVFTSSTGPLVPPEGLAPVYSCVTSGGAHFASNTTTCEGKGTQVALLGYGLAH